MNEYIRLTDKKIDLDKLSEKAKSKISDTYLKYVKMNNALCELENKIENGTLTFSKFVKNQEVYFIGYDTIEYNCPHCGETCYEEKVNGVKEGFICERIITENQDGLEIVYTIQIKDCGKVKLFTKRLEKDIYKTKAEAEKKLNELKKGGG